jgi:peptidoglycan/LPS O-acetylase OafA/YrhL
MDLLLIIRGLAAASVVVWHTVGYQGGFPLVNIPGRIAVWVFFGISGYVIAYGFLHRRYLFDSLGLQHFYLNRFFRIYPLFLLLSLLGWLTIWAGSGSNPLNWKDVSSQIFALQFNHGYKLNGVFWTLGLEIQFYVIAPALAMLFFIKDAQWRWTVIAACYATLLAFNWFAVRYMAWSVDGRNLISVLPHFFVGMVGCGLVSSFNRSNRKGVAYLMGALACLLASNWLYHMQPDLFWSVRGTFLVNAMILFFIFAHASFQPTNANPSRLTRAFLWMGTLSYGIYAWHAYLMSSIDWLTRDLTSLLLASVAIAYISYRWVELPALKLKRWQGTGVDAGKMEVLPGRPAPFADTSVGAIVAHGRKTHRKKESP